MFSFNVIRQYTFTTTALTLGLSSLLILGVACKKSGSSMSIDNSFREEITADIPGLNFMAENEANQTIILGNIYESLLDRDLETYDFIPNLAKSWEVSADGMAFTFELDEKAQWFDGTPVTSADVAFTLDAMLGDKLNSGVNKAVYGSLDPVVEIIDDKKFIIKAKTRHFKNLDLAVSFWILPKHLLEEDDLKKGKLVTATFGSGPYMLEEWKTGDRITLKKNPKYWGMHLKQNVGAFNFNQKIYKIVREPKIGIELLKQGFFSLYVFNAERWERESNHERIQANYDTYMYTNKAPKGYNYIGWNSANPLFSNKNVRLALSHLLNRPFIIEKFFYNHSIPAVSPISSLSDYGPKDLEPIAYDPNKAVEMLKKEGWVDSNKDGILDRNGKKFEFTLMFANPDAEKYLTVYKEDLAKVGITANIQKVDWTTFIKLLDDRKYEACILGWTANVDPDLFQIWHSSSTENQGSNFVGYKNKKVDELIVKAQGEFDRAKRIALNQEVARQIAADAPYTFFLENPKNFVAARKGIKRPKDYLNYSTFGCLLANRAK